MNRGGSIRKARKGECAPCLVASDTSSGIHSERQRRMAHFYTWSATMYRSALCEAATLMAACIAPLRSRGCAPCAAEAAIPPTL